MRTLSTIRVVASAGLMLCCHSGATADEVGPFHVEALPPHLEFRVEQRRANLLPPGSPSAAELVVRRLKRWPPELMPITVCFQGGSTELRVRIMNAALDWTKHGANITFDFGNPASPRTCTSSPASSIKIGFAYQGYWSTVGQDSRDLVNANEQSMNFAFWDVAPASEPEFTQTVLHEFGHALAFEHEHQNPMSTCESEFDWPAIYTYLAGSPNYWNQEKVDFNMRRLSPNPDLVATAPDKKSIMLYTFPKKFYKSGEASSCFTQPNIALSSQDIAFAASMYPSSAAAQLGLRDETVKSAISSLQTSAINAGDRVRAIQEIELLNSPTLNDASRKITIERLQVPRM